MQNATQKLMNKAADRTARSMRRNFNKAQRTAAKMRRNLSRMRRKINKMLRKTDKMRRKMRRNLSRTRRNLIQMRRKMRRKCKAETPRIKSLFSRVLMLALTLTLSVVGVLLSGGFLASCSAIPGYLEPEEQLVVSALGFDAVSDRISVTAQIVSGADSGSRALFGEG